MCKKIHIAILVFLILPPVMLLAQRGSYEKAEESFQASPDEPLEVNLEIDAGEVVVERGPDAHTGHVIIRYTEGEFRERIDFNENKNKLRVELDKRSWYRGKRSRNRRDDDWAEVYLELPSGVDILFDSKIKAGEIEMDMGGLRLREFYLNNLAGELEIRFDEPNPIEMDVMEIDAKVGELRLVGLGNARFKKADINSGIGEIDIDFTGEMVPDAMARVDLDIGEATILLPRDRGVRMQIGGGLSFLSSKNIDRTFYKRGRNYYSDDYEDNPTKFSIRITPGLGELNVER
jgi:hypothetical protein